MDGAFVGRTVLVQWFDEGWQLGVIESYKATDKLYLYRIWAPRSQPSGRKRFGHPSLRQEAQGQRPGRPQPVSDAALWQQCRCEARLVGAAQAAAEAAAGSAARPKGKTQGKALVSRACLPLFATDPGSVFAPCECV